MNNTEEEEQEEEEEEGRRTRKRRKKRRSQRHGVTVTVLHAQQFLPLSLNSCAFSSTSCTACRLPSVDPQRTPLIPLPLLLKDTDVHINEPLELNN